MSSKINRIIAQWRRLIRPHIDDSDIEHYNNARLTMAISIALVVVLNLFYLPYAVHDFITNGEGLEFVLGVALNGIFFWTYHISRRGHFITATYVILSMIIFSVFTSVIAVDDDPEMVFILYYLILPILIASGLLRTWHIIGLAITSVIGLMVFPFVATQYPPEDMPIFFILTFALVLTFINNHRKQIATYREQQLRMSEERYRTLYEAISDAVLIHEDFKFVDANSVFLNLTGYTRESISQIDLMQIIPPEYQEVVAANATNNVVLQVPYVTRIYDANQDVIDVEVMAKTVQLDDRHLRVVAIRDIRHRLEAEQQKIELGIERERNKILSAFITDASHDLRTPLSIMYSSLHLLRLNQDNSRQDRYIDMFTKQTEHMLGLIEDLLAVSQLEKSAADRFDFVYSDLNKVVNQAVDDINMLANTRDVSLRFIPQVNLPTTRFDILEIKRVVRQLVTNGVNYTPSGGSVTVETNFTDSIVQIIVTDTGIGIAEEALPHIFDLFYRVDTARDTTKGGMGLGLAICQEIVNAHGGIIQVESTLGEGSTFSVELPRTEADQTQPDTETVHC